MQWRGVVARLLGSHLRVQSPQVYQTLWFHLAVEGKQYQTLAQHVQSRRLAKYPQFKLSPSRLAPSLKVFLSSVGVMCRCHHQHVCETFCWWSALLADDKLMMCSRPSPPFFWTDERQKTWEHTSFVLFVSHSLLASSLLLDLMLMWSQRRAWSGLAAGTASNESWKKKKRQK